MLTDRWVALVAVSATVGALHPARPGLVLGVVALVAWCAWWRRPPSATGQADGSSPQVRRCRAAVLCIGVALVVSGLAQRSLDGLDGVAEQVVSGEVLLLSDPVPSFGGVRADVRFGGRRLEARIDGVATEAFEGRLAGEIVAVRGELSPASPDQPWLTARHVAGRLTVLHVEHWRPGDPSARLANGLRRTLETGAAPLSERQRSLFTGLVVGDDRRQPADLADDFLGAGLTHLLAVSGQNVAFVLALAGPLLRRLRLWPRLCVTLGVICLFGVMTRFEPSVVRASAMAALAATVAMAGRPTSRVRVIAIAVTILLLVDPLLVLSVGFRLSVSAALAIVVLAPRITSVLSGPAPLREALGVTVAAQLGVAPMLLATFGPIPLASLPANLLAVPVAGLVMVWGLTGGMIAGLVPGPMAVWLHAPTGVALGWLELVADRTARAPLGELGLAHVVGLAAGLGTAVLAGGRNRLRRAGQLVAVLAVAGAMLAAQAPPPLRSAPFPGLVRWHAGGTDVVVLGGVGGRTGLGAGSVLEELRRAQVGTVDLLVVADASVTDELVEIVRQAHPVGAVLAHGAALLDAPPGAVLRPPPDGATIVLGDLTLRLVPAPDRLVVDAAPS